MFFKQKKVIFIIVGLIFVGLIGVRLTTLLHKKALANDKQDKPNTVLLNKSEIYTVSRESIENTLDITGDLSATQQAVISSEIDAKVLTVVISEGQFVKRGQLLATLDSADLSQAVLQQQAQVSAAQAQLELNKQKMSTQQQLLQQGFISQIAFDELQTNYKSALQNYNAQLALLKRVQKQFNDTKIAAPFDGVVYQKSIDAGQFVQKNSKLFAIANLTQLEVKAPIPSDKIALIHLNDTVKFHVENSQLYKTGKISRINPVSEQGTRSYMVYVSVENESGILKPGQFVQGNIVLDRLLDQNVVDCDAIFHKNPDYVMYIDKNNIVHKEMVKVLLMNKSVDKCAIDKVNPGDTLIANTVLTIKDGDKVSLMNY